MGGRVISRHGGMLAWSIRIRDKNGIDYKLGNRKMRREQYKKNKLSKKLEKTL